MNGQDLDSVDYRALYGNPADQYSTEATEACAFRAVAIINGILCPITKFTLDKNTHGPSDTGSITTAIAGNPDWSINLQSALGDGSVIVEVWAGFPTNPGPDPSIEGLTRRFLGLLGPIQPAFTADEVTFSLQSLAAILTAAKITTQFGQPASLNGTPGTSGYTTAQFVAYVGKTYNLQTNIQILGTPKLMTSVYAAKQWVGVRNVRVWDLLIACAELDNVDVFVDTDGVLNYIAPTDIGRQTLAMQWGRDLVDAEGSHAPQYSKTIRVQVNSSTRKTRQSVTTRLSVSATGTVSIKTSSRNVSTQPIFGAAASLQESTTQNSDGSFSTSVGESVGSGGTANSGTTNFQGESGIETYKFSFPNLTVAECNALAIQLWGQISRFEFSLKFKFAVTPELLAKLSVSTLFSITGLPWAAFNNNPASGQQPIVNATGPDAVLQTLSDNRYYYVRRMTESLEVSQGEGGDSPGWIVEIEAVNHPLPAAGENSFGGNF